METVGASGWKSGGIGIGAPRGGMAQNHLSIVLEALSSYPKVLHAFGIFGGIGTGDEEYHSSGSPFTAFCNSIAVPPEKQGTKEGNLFIKKKKIGTRTRQASTVEVSFEVRGLPLFAKTISFHAGTMDLSANNRRRQKR